MLFNSKFPILAAPMNQVSDINLALQISKSGCIPSLTFYNYKNYQELSKDLEIFYSIFPNSEILISFPDREFFNPEFQKLFNQFNFSHAELIHEDLKIEKITEYHHLYFQNLNKKLNQFRQKGLKIISKSLGPWLIEFIETYFSNTFDGYILKNNKAAGLILKREENFNPFDELKILKNKLKNTKIIVSGGIENFRDLKEYLDLGADAVCIGTLFAMSKESKISQISKEKLITIDKRKKKNQLGSGMMLKNAIVFKELKNDNENRTESLRKGIQNLDDGLIYIGSAILNIKEILTIEEIVKILTNDIHNN